MRDTFIATLLLAMLLGLGCVQEAIPPEAPAVTPPAAAAASPEAATAQPASP